jgi:hypothetical protein
MFSSPKENRPGYPDTLRQSVDNPAQIERMLAASSLPFEHRTRIASSAERRALYIHFAWQVAWGIALLVIGKLLSNWRFSFGHFYFAILILMGLISCARSLVANYSALTRWLVYLVVCPLLVAPTLLFHRPYYSLAIGFIAVTLLADRLATHHYYTATAPLLSRKRLWQRLLWQNRFNVLNWPERRIPFYVLAVGAPLLLLAFILYRRQQPVRYLYVDDLLLLGGAIGIAAIVVLLFEPILNFLYGQPVKSPWATLHLVWNSLVDWSTYNLHNRNMPGVFRSPAGPIQVRLGLLFGALLLLAVPLTQLSFYERLHDVDMPGSASTTSRAEPTELQPYQKALLESQPPAERILQEAQPPADSTGPRVIAFPELHIGYQPQSQQQAIDRDIHISYLAFLMMGGPIPKAIAVLIPPLILVPLTFFLCLSPAVSRADSESGALAAPAKEGSRLTSAEWERFVALLKQSSTERERTSFFLGLNAADESPVIVPRSVFAEHAHFLGDSGSGKTTLGLAPLISQMIRAKDCSVVIIDLKGDDPALLENARIEAENAGLRFRWFTNELGKATYVFNPLLQKHLAELSLYQRTDLLTASLGLQYGSDYGRGFFSDANAELLYHALRARPYVGSFVELSEVLKQREPFRNVSAQLKMAGSHLAAIVTRLGSTEALNARPGQGVPQELLEAAIDMRQPFEEPQVVYFHLSSALGTATSAEIARMAMFSLLTASKFVEGKRRQVFLVVDEFQRAVSNNLELFLQTARSMNIGVILANQSLSDLRKPGVDIVSTVRTNTRYRQLFAVGEMSDLQEVIFTSGETLIHGRSWNEMLGMTILGPTGAVRSQTSSEVISPRLRINDLLLASDHPLRSVCHVRRGDGYAQFGGMPFILESTYHISSDEYDTRKRAAWPQADGETFTPTLASTDPIAAEAAPSIHSPPPESQASAAAAQRLISGLDEHFEAQKALRRRSHGSEEEPSPDQS